MHQSTHNPTEHKSGFAPAGLNRGGIEIAQGVMDKLTHAERDAPHQGRVNPIVSFPVSHIGLGSKDSSS